MLDCLDKLLFGQICTSSYPLEKLSYFYGVTLLQFSLIEMHGYFLQCIFNPVTKQIVILFYHIEHIQYIFINLKQHYNFTLNFILNINIVYRQYAINDIF